MLYREDEMTWVGRWKNQYGSIVEITSEADGRIEGTFRTALADSGFYGQTVAIVGVHQGNCIGFSSVGSSATGDRVVSYTGLLRDQKIETAWFVVSDKALVAAREGEAAALKSVNWWRAVTTSVDTFERTT
jgi:avidin family protein